MKTDSKYGSYGLHLCRPFSWLLSRIYVCPGTTPPRPSIGSTPTKPMCLTTSTCTLHQGCKYSTVQYSTVVYIGRTIKNVYMNVYIIMLSPL